MLIKTGEGMRAVLWSSGLIVARNAEIWLKQSIQEHLQIGAELPESANHSDSLNLITNSTDFT